METKDWRPKFVSKGVYGCVFSPPPLCKRRKEGESNPETIGKIFSNVDIYKEEKDTYDNIIAKVNADNKATPKLFKGCDVFLSSIPREERMKCDANLEVVQEVRKPYKQIIMEHGGTSFKEMDDEAFLKTGLLKIIRLMDPVMDVLRELDRKGYIHRDIKPANMLLSSDNNKIFLIDYGLLEKKKMSYSQENIKVLKHNYVFYPLEFFFLGELFEADSTGRNFDEQKERANESLKNKLYKD